MAFIIKIKTDNSDFGSSNDDQFTLPLKSGAIYNFDIDWGDSTSQTVTSATPITHTYPSIGEYEISITENVAGGFPTLSFSEVSGDRLKLLEIMQWGLNTWQTLNRSFSGCSNMTITATDEATANTGSVTDFEYAFNNCSGMTFFPLINTSSATTLYRTWLNCSGLTSFPLLDTSNVTNFENTWTSCSNLTEFPVIDTSSGTNFDYTWSGCTGLLSFPIIDVTNARSLIQTWFGCTSLLSFPLIDTSTIVNFAGAWGRCYSLTTFPYINTSNGVYFYQNPPDFGAWQECTGLITFPALDFSNAVYIEKAWEHCSSLTSFPFIDIRNVTGSYYGFYNTWAYCESLTSFPLLDFSTHTGWLLLRGTWQFCTSLTSFPAIDISNATSVDLEYTWRSCTSLEEMPGLASSIVNFTRTWSGCYSLKNMYDLDIASFNNGTEMFLNVLLDVDFVDWLYEHLSTDISANNRTITLNNSRYSSVGKPFRDILISRSWTIDDNGMTPIVAFNASILDDTMSLTNTSTLNGVEPWSYSFYQYSEVFWVLSINGFEVYRLPAAEYMPSSPFYQMILQNFSHVFSISGDYTVSLSLLYTDNKVYESITGTLFTYPDFQYTYQSIVHVDIGPPSVANFVANPIEGYVPLTVQFIDLSSGGPTDWDWDFGDGSTHSTEQNPTHIYASVGDYTVSLTITGEEGENYIVKTDYISVLNKYIFNMSTFDIAPDPEIRMYLWDAGIANKKSIGIEIKYAYSEGTGFVREQGPSLIFD